MPFTPRDAVIHNRSLAGNRKKQRQWASVWNSVYAKTGDEKRAFMTANSAVKSFRALFIGGHTPPVPGLCKYSPDQARDPNGRWTDAKSDRLAARANASSSKADRMHFTIQGRLMDQRKASWDHFSAARSYRQAADTYRNNREANQFFLEQERFHLDQANRHKEAADREQDRLHVVSAPHYKVLAMCGIGAHHIQKYSPDQPRDNNGRWTTAQQATYNAEVRTKRAKQAIAIASREASSSKSARIAAEANERAAKSHEYAEERNNRERFFEQAQHHGKMAEYHRQQQDAFQLTADAADATDQAASSDRNRERRQAAVDHAVAGHLHASASRRHSEIGNQDLGIIHTEMEGQHRRATREARHRHKVEIAGGVLAAIGLTGAGKKFAESSWGDWFKRKPADERVGDAARWAKEKAKGWFSRKPGGSSRPATSPSTSPETGPVDQADQADQPSIQPDQPAQSNRSKAAKERAKNAARTGGKFAPKQPSGPGPAPLPSRKYLPAPRTPTSTPEPAPRNPLTSLFAGPASAKLRAASRAIGGSAYLVPRPTPGIPVSPVKPLRGKVRIPGKAMGVELEMRKLKGALYRRVTIPWFVLRI